MNVCCPVDIALCAVQLAEYGLTVGLAGISPSVSSIFQHGEICWQPNL